MLARQLHEALYSPLDEATNPTDPAADIARSLNTLIKREGGTWKSDRQARFILSRMGMPLLKDRNAEAWAHKNGFEGKAIAVTQLISRLPGRRSAKARYFAQAFVVDDSGVVVRAKVKVIHPKEGHGISLDWSHVEVNFKRTKKPTITVDLEAEKQKQVAANKPHIDLIKSIPGWEGKDILVSFLKQLEAGRTLTVGQMQVVQKLMPEPSVLAGDKSEWKQDLENWKKLGVKIITMMKDDHVPSEHKRRKEYEQAKKAWMDAHDGKEPSSDLDFWLMSEPTPDHDAMLFNTAISEIKKQGYTTDNRVQWIERHMIYSMGVLGNRRYWPRTAMWNAKDIVDQFHRAIKAKRPTKKAIDVIMWARRINGYIDNPAKMQKAVDHVD